MIRKMVIAGGLVWLAMLALVAALLFSNAGLSTTVRLVNGLSGGEILIGESHGRLAGAWRLENVVMEMGGGRITVGELACRWQPQKLLRGTLSIGMLSARQVTVTLADTEREQIEVAPVKGPGKLPSLGLPFAVLLGSLEVNELSILDEAGGELFSLLRMFTGLALEHGQLNLTEMRLQTADFQVDLAGSVGTAGDWPLNLDGSWSVDLPDCSFLRGTAAVSGSVVAAEISLQLEQPQAVTMNTTLSGLPSQLSWQVQAGGRQLDPAAICPTWPAATLDLSLAASGSASDYRGDIAITAAAPDLPTVSVTLPVTGTLAGLILEHGRLEGDSGSGRLDGRLNWRDELSWQLELDGSGFVPGSFNPSLAGPLDLTLHADGNLGDTGLSWQAEISALHYQSEVIDEPLTGRGLLTGSATGLDGDVQFTAGGSSVSVQAAVGWIDGLDWDGRVVLDAFDPSLLDDLPVGAIDAAIASRGRSGGQHLEVEATVERLSGSLAGYQIAGGGGLTYRDGRLLVNDLQVNNGANRLVVDGTIDDRLDLKIEVEGAELERLYEPLHGDVALSGRLSGTRSAPEVDGRLTATSLAYRGYGLQSGSGTVRFGHDGPETIDVAVQVRELTGDGVTVEHGSLQVAGVRGDHRFDLDLRTAAGRLRVMLAGALSEQWRWAGTLQEADFVSETYGDWQQSGTAACLFAADQVEFDGLCIASGASSLCADGAWHSAGDWSVDLSSLHLALGDLHGWGIANSPLAGSIEGNLSLGGEGILLRHTAGTFSAAELSINVGEGGWYPELRWNDSRLEVKLVDQRLTAGLSSRFSDASLLTARLAINEVTGFDSDFRRLPISGRILLDDVAPDPLAPLTDDYLLPSGRLTADLDIGGELGRPWLSGRVDLEDGQIGFPELGIALSDLQGTVHGRGERLTVELRGRSGDGTAHGSGEMSFPRSGWSGNFRISGDNCLLVNQSELMIVASPQVELTIGPDGGSLNGRILVPEALVQPEEMRGSVSPSSDVVFADQNEESSTWPFRFNVDVELGETVRVEGYGVDAVLNGGLVVSDTPEQGMTGRGELVIADGTFALYGQPLQISRGRLVFTGGMVDNPDLDIVARKTVQGAAFGPDGAVVGVKVTGSAQDYHLELFSQPTMAENDIVAYLLLDKPIAAGDDSSRGIVNEAISAVGLAAGNDILGDITGFLPIDDLHLEGSADRGGASLVLGKRLTDDLSISYDFNLFEHAAAFRVRYEFGRGFSVQSRNSIESNGVELLYSFER